MCPKTKGRFIYMKKIFKEKGKRLLALFLSILTVVGIMPTTVFAFSPSEGQKVSSYYGDYYVGSDRQYYYSSDSYSYLVYDSNGNTTVRTSSGGEKFIVSTFHPSLSYDLFSIFESLILCD